MSRVPATITTHAGLHTSPRRTARFRVRGASLGLTAKRIDDLVRQIERGLPFTAMESLADCSGLPLAAIASVVGIPERTFARRKVTGRFTLDESERLLRIANVFEKATQLFEGNVAGAVTWLTNPKKAFGHETPLAYSRTEVGAHEVENLIGRLEHGVFS